MPTAAASIRREHVEAFIAAKLARTAPSSAATRYRSLQQLFKWLDDVGEIDASPMAKMRSRSSLSSRYLSCPMIRSEACSLSGPVGTSATVATPRLSVFLDTGMRLEGMGGLRYSANDVDSSDVDLRSRVVRITAKGRREMVLSNGAKTARDLDRTSAPVLRTHARPIRGCGSARRARRPPRRTAPGHHRPAGHLHRHRHDQERQDEDHPDAGADHPPGPRSPSGLVRQPHLAL